MGQHEDDNLARGIWLGKPELVRRAIRDGANVDTITDRTGDGKQVEKNVVAYAAQRSKDPEVFVAVAEAAVRSKRFGTRDDMNETALESAVSCSAFQDRPWILSVLLEAGTNVGLWKTKRGQTILNDALSFCLRFKKKDATFAVVSLLGAGADPNAPIGGKPPLFYTTAEPTQTAALLHAGADPWAADSDGFRSWDSKELTGAQTMVKMAALKKMRADELPPE